MARPTGRHVREELMVAARTAIQQRGPARMSYGDLAAELGVRAPSLHHHFPRKSDLVFAATRRYREEFRARVDALDAADGIDRIRRYVKLFCAPAERDLLCLCAAIAGDWHDCDEHTRAEVETFFADERAWLIDQLTHGRRRGEVRDGVPIEAFADALIAVLEGALLLARTGTVPDPEATAESLIALIRTH